MKALPQIFLFFFDLRHSQNQFFHGIRRREEAVKLSEFVGEVIWVDGTRSLLEDLLGFRVVVISLRHHRLIFFLLFCQIWLQARDESFDFVAVLNLILLINIHDFLQTQLIHHRLPRFEEAHANSEADLLFPRQIGEVYHSPPVEEFKSVLILAISQIPHQNLSSFGILNSLNLLFLLWFYIESFEIHYHLHFDLFEIF